MNNLSSYHGLIDAIINASDKDLPVINKKILLHFFFSSNEFQKIVCTLYISNIVHTRFTNHSKRLREFTMEMFRKGTFKTNIFSQLSTSFQVRRLQIKKKTFHRI